MSESNVEIARRGFEAAMRGDLETVREFLDPAVQWHGGDPSSGCRSRDEAIEYMTRAWRVQPIGELVELIDAGDKVVVITRRPGDGDEPPVLSANVTTFRDGRAIEMIHYPDPADARAAAGV